MWFSSTQKRQQGAEGHQVAVPIMCQVITGSKLWDRHSLGLTRLWDRQLINSQSQRKEQGGTPERTPERMVHLNWYKLRLKVEVHVLTVGYILKWFMLFRDALKISLWSMDCRTAIFFFLTVSIYIWMSIYCVWFSQSWLLWNLCVAHGLLANPWQQRAELATESVEQPANTVETAFWEKASVRQVKFIPDYRWYIGLGW